MSVDPASVEPPLWVPDGAASSRGAAVDSEPEPEPIVPTQSEKGVGIDSFRLGQP